MNYNITNFPQRYSFLKRWFYQGAYLLGEMRLNFREKALKKRDKKAVKRIIKRGDVFLVGDLKVASRVLTKGPLTHSMMYTGAGQFYHSIAHGVERISLGKVFKKYDTCVLLRPVYLDKKGIGRAVRFIKAQKGKPYNFDTAMEGDSYYCTELVRDALCAGGVDAGLSGDEGFLSRWSYVDPMDFLGVGMEMLYHSANLKVEEGEARKV